MPQFTYDYPMPSATVDLAAFRVQSGKLLVAMIQRRQDPFAGAWAFPGGFVEIDEDFESAARREMKEETGYDVTTELGFVGVFGRPGRDPRGRTISIVQATVIPADQTAKVKGSDDAKRAEWVERTQIPKLAFDHTQIMRASIAWLKNGVMTGRLAADLLPKTFRKRDVSDVFAAIFGDPDGATSWLNRAKREELIKTTDKRGVYAVVRRKPKATVYAFPFEA